MIYLFLAICCSLALGAIFKHISGLGLDRMQLLAYNYLVASAVGVSLLSARNPAAVQFLRDPPFLGLAVGTGFVLVCGFFVFALSTERAGMSMTVAVMRVGVAIPFLASWLLWGEDPTLGQWIGLGLVAAALFMITRPKSPSGSGARSAATSGPGIHPASGAGGSVASILLLVFITGGSADLMFKGFDVKFGGQVGEDAFITVAFGVAFLLSALVLTLRREPLRDVPATVLWGGLLGLVNYGSLLFILGAVARLPAAVVFPTNAVAIVVGAAALGVIIWKEELSLLNRAGVGLAAVAVLFLNA
ncbi:MAG: drug/metabolite transporter (DMT)-like permease [Rhodothermales bacterium]|jgi:drug/metabolite transporter (DMT)-like permease